MGSRFMRALIVLTLAAAAAGLAAAPALAGSVTYTDSAAFAAAIAGYSGVSTVNFDSLIAGPISQGTTVGNIAFTSSLCCGDGLAIVDAYPTTSSPNYLGSTDPGTPGAFFGGDSITMNFSSPVNAVGMFLIVGGTVNAGDFSLTTSSGTALGSATPDSVANVAGATVYFLGLTSTTAFSSATLTLSGTPDTQAPWNIDDITTGVTPSGGPGPTPEPSSLLLLASGLGVFAFRMRRA